MLLVLIVNERRTMLMGNEKDVTEKSLEAYNEVFADIVNVLLFNGKRIMKEDELQKESERSHYKFESEIHEQERDVSKFWLKNNVKIALVGIENQTDPDDYMPIRIMGYDGASYRGQLLDVDEKKKVKGVYPVVTLVLYFGRRRWDKPLRLKDVVKVPEELKEYFNDYKINLFEISYLPAEQVEMFQSDFKVVADYFVQTRINGEYNPPDTLVRHVHEVLELMNSVTKDIRFEEAMKEYEGQRGEISMSEIALDKIEARGEARGVIIGEARGERKVIERAIRKGSAPKIIAEVNDIPLDKVLEIQNSMLEEAK